MRLISEFATLRNDLKALFVETAEILNHGQSEIRIGKNELRSLDVLAQDLEQTKFTLAVVGVIKRGKSTLLNAMLEAESEILSTSVTPETARLSFLVYSDQPHAVIHRFDGEPVRIELSDLPKYTSTYGSGILKRGRGEKALVENTNYAEIHYPNRFLKDGVVIVDTPGVDDPDVRRARVTEEFVAKADAVIFLINAQEGGLKDSELQFLKSRIINKKSSKGIICACNKILALRKHQFAELEQLIASTRSKLTDELGIHVPVYPIDAKAAFQARGDRASEDYQKSGFADFLHALEAHLINNKGKIMLTKRITDLEIGILSPVLQQLEYDLTLVPENLIELEHELEKNESRLNRQKKLYEKFHAALERERKKLQAWVEQSVREEYRDIPISEKMGGDYLQTCLAKSAVRLEERLNSRMRQRLMELVDQLEGAEIRIPKLKFQIENPEIAIADFYVEKTVKNTNASNKQTATMVGAVGGAVLAAILFPGIGALLFGAIAGAWSGSKFKDKETSTKVVELDKARLQRELNATVDRIVNSYIELSENHFNIFTGTVDKWFSDQEKRIHSSKKSIEFARKRSQREREKHCAAIKSRQDQFLSIQSRLETIKQRIGSLT